MLQNRENSQSCSEVGNHTLQHNTWWNSVSVQQFHKAYLWHDGYRTTAQHRKSINWGVHWAVKRYNSKPCCGQGHLWKQYDPMIYFDRFVLLIIYNFLSVVSLNQLDAPYNTAEWSASKTYLWLWDVTQNRNWSIFNHFPEITYPRVICKFDSCWTVAQQWHTTYGIFVFSYFFF